MPTEVTGAIEPPLTRRERAACEQLLAAMLDSLRRRLPMTLELVGLELELARSDLAAELVDEVARRRDRERLRRKARAQGSG
jgi:hypothetical protein